MPALSRRLLLTGSALAAGDVAADVGGYIFDSLAMSSACA